MWSSRLYGIESQGKNIPESRASRLEDAHVPRKPATSRDLWWVWTGKETGLQRHAGGQRTHEKMLNITAHQGNTNQNRHEIPLHASNNCHRQKSKRITSAGQDVDEKEPSCAPLVGMQTGAAALENCVEGPQTVKNSTSIRSSNRTSGCISTGNENRILKTRHGCHLMFTAVEIWKQPTCLQMSG